MVVVRKGQIGFTMIELLVVIAVIGLLASMILLRMDASRLNADDARVKAEMTSLVKLAAIEENNVHTYDIVCGTNGYTVADSIARQIASIETFSNELTVCRGQADSYAISVPIGDGSVHFCVDSDGKRVERATELGGGELSCL